MNVLVEKVTTSLILFGRTTGVSMLKSKIYKRNHWESVVGNIKTVTIERTRSRHV